MIVLDCSAMIHALVGSPVDPHVLGLLGDEDVHAPNLLDFEVASALRGHWLGGKLSADRLDQAVQDFADLTVNRHPMTELLVHVLGLRDNFTAYDAAYVVLAQALECPLVTADRKLLPAERLGVEVQLLAS